VPGEERVFSLVLALVASPQGLTRTELLSSVYGYAHRHEPGVIDATVGRQFERDKEQLRRLGIPLETIDSPLEPGNNQLTRYRISKERLQLPHTVTFTPEELTMLNFASFAWSEGSLASESRWATMKLAALGADVDLQHIGLAPKLSISEPAAPALQRAIEERRVVTFRYQLPDRDEPLERRVAPLRLHRAEGRWHLIAHDVERQAGRVFLLSRIMSDVRLTAEDRGAHLCDDVDRMIAELESRLTEGCATVFAVPGSIAEARLSGRSATACETHVTPESHSGPLVSIHLHTLDLAALADELVSFGSEVVAFEPQELRDRVVAALQAVREQHAHPAEVTNG
jgi:proteasome accessory factor B